MNVLVVSPKANFLADELKVLAQNNLSPHHQPTVEEACKASREIMPTLVILDAEASQDNLASTCRTLHSASQAPVIVVSQEALSEVEAAACYDAGAGARLLVGVSPTMLLAWANALVRRQGRRDPS